jgi:hypothetical protein
MVAHRRTGAGEIDTCQRHEVPRPVASPLKRKRVQSRGRCYVAGMEKRGRGVEARLDRF